MRFHSLELPSMLVVTPARDLVEELLLGILGVGRMVDRYRSNPSATEQIPS